MILMFVVLLIIGLYGAFCGAKEISALEALSSNVNSSLSRVLGDSTSLLSNLEKAKELAQSTLSLIRNRYELDKVNGGQFFLTANNMKAKTWDMIKYKFLVKILGEDKVWLSIFGGSSVTAGHDNYYKQAYPFIFDMHMSPILTVLGVKMHTHNIAQGANNCSPYQLCYEAMGGVDADLIGWEQSYNCGHDDAIFELAARFAGWSKRKGIVYYSASGAWIPNKCEMSTDKPPFCDEKWTEESAGLEKWSPNKEALKKEKDQLQAYAAAALSAHRFADGFAQGHDYSGVGAHGFNVWESNSKCKSRDEQGNQKLNCNGIDAAGGCAMRFMSKEAAWFGKEDHSGANWHPTRAFHMLRGEAIAWLYTLALLDGIFELQEALLKGQTEKALYAQYEEKLATLHKPLPSPAKCDGYYHCSVRPLCFTDYLPHYPSDMSLKDVIVGKTHWRYEAEEFSDWSLKYGYKDAKPVWLASGNQGDIHVKVIVNHINTVWICGTVGESLKHAIFYLDKNIEKDALVGYTPTAERVKWEHKKYMNGECTAIQELPRGNHVISVSTENAPNQHVSGLSHVIMWPY